MVPTPARDPWRSAPPGPVLEHRVQPLQLPGDTGGVPEPVLPQLGQLVLQHRAAHLQQQPLALVQHLVELVLLLRQTALQALGGEWVFQMDQRSF